MLIHSRHLGVILISSSASRLIEPDRIMPHHIVNAEAFVWIATLDVIIPKFVNPLPGLFHSSVCYRFRRAVAVVIGKGGGRAALDRAAPPLDPDPASHGRDRRALRRQPKLF
jgi:hypothetical protein